MLGFLSRFVDSNERELKHIQPLVDEINALEPEFESLSDEEIRDRIAGIREELREVVQPDEPDEDELHHPDLERRKEIAKARRKKEQARVQEALDEVLPEVFAAAREATKRSLGKRHFDVQLIGGVVLHQGKIPEMRTGEGKTFAAPLAAALNALTGRGVHIVTPNDYLARRDGQWMGPIYHLLGLSVGMITHDTSYVFEPGYPTTDERLIDLRPCSRQEAYAADITYGTNNEFGFDYLRDNMVAELDQRVQRERAFGIVDEVDNILIDEARTPLIISGQAEESADKYYTFARLVPKLKGRPEGDEEGGDYFVDLKDRAVSPTEQGIEKMEQLLGIANLYDADPVLARHFEQALRAHALYKRDRDYIVKEGEIVIVDEFTGRQMPGRRWSEGLHQAIEAKEGMRVQRESVTLATITFQNYFRLYDKLAGMTGTAMTEAEEFHKIYGLEVVAIPTHMPMVRDDDADLVFRNENGKFNALIEEIQEMTQGGRPVLVGTTSVEKSEILSGMLKRLGITHEVLNAKFHEKESGIVAQAGKSAAVTIATNMAGRGTDILLGGNPDFMTREFLKEQEIDPDEATESQWQQEYGRAKHIVESEHQEVVSLGGLHILGTERHESRRIDNQLRGRAGRQGDPGSSRFFLSLEDDLMRIFAGDKVKALMQRLGMEQGVAIESKMVSKRIAAAQKSVEGRNFETRKHLLEYDDVMNKQRETIYGLRRQLMEEPDQREYLVGETGVARDLLTDITKQYLDLNASPDDWDVENYKVQIHTIYALDCDAEAIDFKESAPQEIEELIWEKLKAKYAEKEKQIGDEAMRTYERIIMLNIIDAQWKDHLLALDHLKQGIGLVGYGQKDPLVEYKKESFDMFQAMLDRIDTTTIRSLFNLQVVEEQPPETLRQRRGPRRPLTFTGPNQGAAAAGEEAAKVKTVVRSQPKVGRNDPCPCGSGKKYKKCHGA